MYTVNKLTGKKVEEIVNLWPETIHGLAVYSEEVQHLKDRGSILLVVLAKYINANMQRSNHSRFFSVVSNTFNTSLTRKAYDHI